MVDDLPASMRPKLSTMDPSDTSASNAAPRGDRALPKVRRRPDCRTSTARTPVQRDGSLGSRPMRADRRPFGDRRDRISDTPHLTHPPRLPRVRHGRQHGSQVAMVGRGPGIASGRRTDDGAWADASQLFSADSVRSRHRSLLDGDGRGCRRNGRSRAQHPARRRGYRPALPDDLRLDSSSSLTGSSPEGRHRGGHPAAPVKGHGRRPGPSRSTLKL